MACYQYQPITNPNSIRILKLAPSDGTAALRFTLEVVSLDSSPQYKALSYTWGTQAPLKHIYCDGKILLIGENCEEALLHLQSTTETVVLWIDAICIDQSSVAERTQQVQLMGDIYRRANQVLIWLGKQTKECELAFKYLYRFAEGGNDPTQYDRFIKILSRDLEQMRCKAQNRDFLSSTSS
jgi:heterokaryon incompatibility protein (HET)